MPHIGALCFSVCRFDCPSVSSSVWSFILSHFRFLKVLELSTHVYLWYDLSTFTAKLHFVYKKSFESNFTVHRKWKCYWGICVLWTHSCLVIVLFINQALHFLIALTVSYLGLSPLEAFYAVWVLLVREGLRITYL